MNPSSVLPLFDMYLIVLLSGIGCRVDYSCSMYVIGPGNTEYYRAVTVSTCVKRTETRARVCERVPFDAASARTRQRR